MRPPTDKKKKRAWPRPICPGCGIPVPFKQAVQDVEGVWKHLNCQGKKG